VASEPVRFHLDEQVNPAIAAGLRKHGVDVTTTPEVGLRGAGDDLQLDYVRRERRVLVTHDADFLRYHAQGIEHAGIVYCHKEARTIGQIIEALRLIYALLTAEEMAGRIEYL
jgi:predicted nuclease of predicted toxin-antitoxin system